MLSIWTPCLHWFREGSTTFFFFGHAEREVAGGPSKLARSYCRGDAERDKTGGACASGITGQRGGHDAKVFWPAVAGDWEEVEAVRTQRFKQAYRPEKQDGSTASAGAATSPTTTSEVRWIRSQEVTARSARRGVNDLESWEPGVTVGDGSYGSGQKLFQQNLFWHLLMW